ncbi:hypothetical protein P280DRAFT_446843 [Massarina eburnea CBS 473.64]|uniref:SET domain-containing protein n=1 Tax=Massarina eburnea CBS 473.64 TaxID=1395130 RepID=A0A6A6S7Z9_9PLEO|nr:hypothetical protein P280DRAFT_446843 [Massarina eburnea CBS 473.64]
MPETVVVDLTGDDDASVSSSTWAAAAWAFTNSKENPLLLDSDDEAPPPPLSTRSGQPSGTTASPKNPLKSTSAKALSQQAAPSPASSSRATLSTALESRVSQPPAHRDFHEEVRVNDLADTTAGATDVAVGALPSLSVRGSTSLHPSPTCIPPPVSSTETSKPKELPYSTDSTAPPVPVETVAEPSSREATSNQPQSIIPAVARDNLPNCLQVIDSRNLIHSVAIIDKCLEKHLQQGYQSHAYLVKACLRRNRESLERETRLKERSLRRGFAPTLTSADKFIQRSSPFKVLQPIQSVTVQPKEHFLSEKFFIKSGKLDRPIKTTKMTIESTQFRTMAVDIPTFQEYVSLQNSFLAENVNELLNWPYFENDENTDKMEQNGIQEELQQSYRIRDAASHLTDDINRFYSPIAETFLSEIGINWEHVLFWLLASTSDIETINGHGSDSREFKKPLSKRNSKLTADCDGFKWKYVLAVLPRTSLHQLRLAALAGSAFAQQTTFGIWQLARRSDPMRKAISCQLQGTTEETSFDYRSAACRVCQVHYCLHHGELKQNASEEDAQTESDSENDVEQDDEGKDGSQDGSQGDSQDDTDDSSDIQEVINYRRMVNTTATATDTTGQPTRAQDNAIPPRGKFNINWWIENSNGFVGRKVRKPFYPCHHPGTSCITADCRCYRERVTCEKFCTCSLSCTRRFPGCSCAQVIGTSKRRVCGNTSQCDCFNFGRECDADLCGSCGATDMLDPVNRYEDDPSKCCNVTLQRGVQKKTLLGNSEVHGFGLYAGEDIKRNALIGEYIGEIVTKQEADRREKVYTKLKTLYLFKLNKDQEVDASHFGNKTRFINNADKQFSNCYARTVFCNTVNRIALYASENIKAGTELFFDYGYDEKQKKDFKQPSQSRAKPTPITSSSSYKSRSSTLASQTEANQQSSSAPQRALKSAPSTAPRRVLSRNMSMYRSEDASPSTNVPTDAGEREDTSRFEGDSSDDGPVHEQAHLVIVKDKAPKRKKKINKGGSQLGTGRPKRKKVLDDDE